jgi:hypothetical protein
VQVEKVAGDNAYFECYDRVNNVEEYREDYHNDIVTACKYNEFEEGVLTITS